jgi:type IV secretory pathway VirB2 component (pilin)
MVAHLNRPCKVSVPRGVPSSMGARDQATATMRIECEESCIRHACPEIQLPPHRRSLVIETSLGYAFGLELNAALVSLQLHTMLDGLIASVDRVETAARAGAARHSRHAAVVDSHPTLEVFMPLRSDLFTTPSVIIRAVIRRGWLAIVALLVVPTISFAQSPWERASANLATSFTGPLARSLALVAIVIGGLMFMFGEGGAKRQISGIVFGGGLALFAAQFLTWLF